MPQLEHPTTAYAHPIVKFHITRKRFWDVHYGSAP